MNYQINYNGSDLREAFEAHQRTYIIGVLSDLVKRPVAEGEVRRVTGTYDYMSAGLNYGIMSPQIYLVAAQITEKDRKAPRTAENDVYALAENQLHLQTRVAAIEAAKRLGVKPPTSDLPLRSRSDVEKYGKESDNWGEFILPYPTPY